MIDFDYDPDIDDESLEDDDSDIYRDDDITGIKSFVRKHMNKIFGNRLYRLQKMQLKNERLRVRGLNKAQSVKAKRYAKLSIAIGLVSLIYKFMVDHHQDKLDSEEKREFMEIAKKYGLSNAEASQIASMSAKQAQNAVGTGVSGLLQGVVNN